MADTSERIIILSFIILFFIASQSRIQESIRLEISTDKQEYIIGESVKSTFYIVNPNPVSVKIEPYNMVEVDAFINGIPQEIGRVVIAVSASGAKIKIPPESRHKISSVTFNAKESGNLTINLNILIKNDLAGSARHTVQILEPEREYQVLWDGDIEVADPRFLSSDKNESLDMSAFQGLSSKLRTLVAKGIPEVKNFYVHYSMDWQNGTANIVLTDTSENVTRFILDQFSPPVREKIRFLKSLAPRSQIREWRGTLMELCLGRLKERGVKWTAMSTYYDGRIRLDVEEITPETIDIIKEVIEGRVPPGVIVIWESGPMTELNEQDIDVEIYTPRQNYTLGENFTAIVYFVNNESVEVWVEAVSHHTINSYSLSHPEESLSADVHDAIDIENPWMHIPENSRIKLDYMQCKPQYTGEFTITCLGAEKTVLILDPNIQPYEYTSSNGTIVSGPLGDLSRLDLTMNCTLPSTLEYVPRLKIERIPITNSTAETIAVNAFNFSDIEKIEKRTGSLAVVEGNKRLYFYGLNDIFYQTLGDKTVVEDWSEPEIRAIADEFLENLYNYWQVPTEAHIEFDTIRPSYVTVHEDGTEDVNKIGARYRVKVASIKLYGPGADFSLSIADGNVYDVELHLPSVFIEEYTDLPLSPQEAVDRFLAGNYSIEVLGFTTLYGAIPREGQLTIEKVELVYFIDHHSDPPQTYPPLCYMISGTIIGPAPFGDEIIRIDFHELIPVT